MTCAAVCSLIATVFIYRPSAVSARAVPLEA
jgi:hypothetical protein